MILIEADANIEKAINDQMGWMILRTLAFKSIEKSWCVTLFCKN